MYPDSIKDIVYRFQEQKACGLILCIVNLCGVQAKNINIIIMSRCALAMRCLVVLTLLIQVPILSYSPLSQYPGGLNIGKKYKSAL